MNGNNTYGSGRPVKGQIDEDEQVAVIEVPFDQVFGIYAQSYPGAQGGGAVVAPIVAGIGWDIIKGIANSSGEVTYKMVNMKGFKYPFDKKDTYNFGPWSNGKFTAWSRMYTTLKLDEISASFTVKYQYNGHAVGNIEVLLGKTEGSWAGWDLHIENSIMPDNNAHTMKKTGKTPVACVRVTFTHRYKHSWHDDNIYREEFFIYGDGQLGFLRKWIQY